MSSTILRQLDDPELVALQAAGGDWGDSFFAATLIPDKWMGLVVRPDGRRRFVPAGEDPAPESRDSLVLVRNQPITIACRVEDVPAADDHAVTAEVELLLRCGMREDDLAALHRALVSTSRLDLGALGDAAEQAGASAALREFVRSQPARRLVHDDLRDELLAHLRKALTGFAFSAGLEVERLGRISFESPSLAAHTALERDTARQVRAMEARQRVEQAALAATQRRLGSLADILDKLKGAAEADGSLRWRDLLPTLTPSERGRLLENLWRLTPNARTARAIAVIAGQDCILLDPGAPERVLQRVTLPDELGGLRSVTFDGRGELLVGAATGVWRLDADSGDVIERYPARCDEPPRTGFNAAVVSDDVLFATHSQLGAWSWPLTTPADGQALLAPIGGVPKTVRAVTVDERGRVLLAADDRVHAFDLRGQTAWQTAPAGSSIHCLAPLGEWLYVGTSGGALLRCDLNLRDAWMPVHRTLGAIESVDARRWDDLIELVIPAASQGVIAIYAEESIVSRLLDTPSAIRRTWACDDTLVGLNETRDRLYVLNGDMPERAGREVPIARLVGRSIQDACLVVATAQEPQS